MLAHLATADGGLRAEIGRYSSFFDMNSHDALHCPLMFGAGMTDGLPPVTRREFFTSLAGTGVDTQRAAPILLNGLGSDDPWIRAVCVWALGRCSLDGMEVRQRILALHNDPDEQVRRAVVEYTSRLDLDERVVAITTDALGDASANVQYGALAAAEWRGSSGGVFVGMIGPMIEHAKNDFDARLAAVAFVKVGGDPSVAIPTILRMLKSTRSERPAYSRGSEVDRTMSLEAVLAVAPLLQARAPELLGEVSTLMSDSVPSVRAIAAQAFACLGGDEERATRVVLDAVVAESAGGVPGGRAWNAMFGLTRSGHLSVSVMAEWLDSEKAGRRAEAARQLGDAGARSVSALPRLRELRHDPIAQVAEWADDAVKRIEWEIENPDEASRLRAEQVR
jgi:HEAT repeat protein